MCHEPSGVALGQQIGVGKGTVSLQDFEAGRPDPGVRAKPRHQPSAHARRTAARGESAGQRARLQPAARARAGALRRSAGTRWKCCTAGRRKSHRDYYQLRIGGDLAAITGITKHVLERGARAHADGKPPLLDEAFIETHTDGFDALHTSVAAADWQDIERESGSAKRACAMPANASCDPSAPSSAGAWASPSTGAPWRPSRCWST